MYLDPEPSPEPAASEATFNQPGLTSSRNSMIEQSAATSNVTQPSDQPPRPSTLFSNFASTEPTESSKAAREALKQYILRHPWKEGDDPVIIRSTWLDHINSYVHKRLRTVICQTCQKAINPKNLVVHAKDQHQLSHGITSSQLEFVCQYYHLVSPSDVPQRNDKVLIPHLPVHDGFACTYPDCNYVSGTIDTRDRHASKHRTAQSGSSKNPRVKQGLLPPLFRACKMQTVYSPIPTHYFEVIPPAPPIGTAYDQWVEDTKDIPETLFNPEGSHISFSEASSDVTPFLQFTQWHIHLKDQRQDKAKGEALYGDAAKPYQLSKLVQKLYDIVFNYFKHIRDLLRSLPHHVRRLLLKYPLYVNITFSIF